MMFTCLQCGEKFLRLSLLQRHRLEMNHWKDLTCQFCNKTFTRRSNLRRHLATHSSAANELCDVCGTLFFRRDNLLRHLRDSHSVEPRNQLVRPVRAIGSNFELQKLQGKRFEKFRSTFNTYKLCFDEVQFNNVSDALSYSVTLLNDVIELTTAEFKPNDYLQLSLVGEDMDNRISTPFVQKKLLDSERIFSVAESVYQSKENLLMKKSIKVEVSQIDMPTGDGRNRCLFEDTNVFIRKKTSIISITNDDDLCCARAIVTAKARLDEHEKWNLIRRGFQPQKDLALMLHRQADVPTGECGIDELKKFQEVLPDYQIIVVSREHMNNVIFSGPPCGKKLYLYLHDSHYDVITSMAGLLAKDYFCETCYEGYKHPENHKCINTCQNCFKVHTESSGKWITCRVCSRRFKGRLCFDLHKQTTSKGNSTCSKYRLCKDCGQLVRPKDRKTKHTCFEKFCKVCNYYFPVDHKCYMQVRSPKSNTQNQRFIFFDFECTQDDLLQCDEGYEPDENGKCMNCLTSKCGAYEHVPNLCVAHKVCSSCMNHDVNENSECRCCERNELIFSGENTVDDFCKWLFSTSNRHAIVIAHNFKSYDSYPILKYLHRNCIEPKIVPNGGKIMSMEVTERRIKIIDSLNFLPMALSKLPATFGFDNLVKGYFPHAYNRKENQNVVMDHLPDQKFYDPDSMLPPERKQFLEWYEQHKNDRFDFQEELLRYCRSDVEILRKCVLKFRQDFIDITDIDPLANSTTIASACQLVFRANFLKHNTIGIIPARGYSANHTQSAKALQWLKYVASETGHQIQHARNGDEKIIGRYKVDGYYETSAGEKVVLEFHGDFWHGNPKKYSADLQNPVCKKTMGQLYQETLDKKQFLEDQGYKYISIWESEWDQRVKEDQNVSQFVQRLEIVTPLQPREAFYGGRTETFTLYRQASENETIHYSDVTSLYPFINKTGKVPLGHPVIITEGFGDLSQYEGLIKCKIVPPRELYIPVLPSKINGKLLFALCKTCAELQNQRRCIHSDDERALIGTWVTDEVKKAVERGYVVEKIYEVWHFTDIARYDPVTQTGGVFTDYVNTFLKVKQEASGWPAWCVSEQDKKCYIELYEEKEGIKLDYDKIIKNPGRRALAKLCLNSLWGKLGQRDNLPHVDFVQDPKVLFDHLTSPNKRVTSLNFVSDEIVAMNWQHDDDFVESSGKTNVVIAAYTTAQARLKLYSYLERLNTRMLYCDTDSVVYFSMKGDSNPSLGDYLGDLTDEIPKGNAIQKFVSCGPKNYAYQLQEPSEDGSQTCCKVRGITLNHRNRLIINFDTLYGMIKSDDIVKLIEETTIKRDQKTATLYTANYSKDYRLVFDKRRRLNPFVSVPFGY